MTIVLKLSFYNVSVYHLQGIGVVLPIENKMKTPEAFGGWCGVINLGMTIATVFYAAVGFYGYLKFGDEVQDSITLNLPPDQGYVMYLKFGHFPNWCLPFYIFMLS